jgi:hypothetical protein
MESSGDCAAQASESDALRPKREGECYDFTSFTTSITASMTTSG